jgi:SAM-dependent methyltransferase
MRPVYDRLQPVPMMPHTAVAWFGRDLRLLGHVADALAHPLGDVGRHLVHPVVLPRVPGDLGEQLVLRRGPEGPHAAGDDGSTVERLDAYSLAVREPIVQRNLPPGVPPLALTGERTLPDVPEENYWFRRHLVVYEWIAERVGGLRVVDLASGEGYGAAVLARRAARVVGIEPNPEAWAHAQARYAGQRLAFRRDLAETFTEPCDALVFLQTIEHVQDPDAVLARIRAQLAPGGTAYVSTPNVLTLAPPGHSRSGNPWHVREYRPGELTALCRRHFGSVELLGLFHARRLRVHELALRAGWDRVHAALGVTRPFYDRFVPALDVRDFALRRGRLERALDLLAVLRA